ncbi:hypothetical protein R83H12_00158 [Fibrobacteria bacterium R8-3-H12]
MFARMRIAFPLFWAASAIWMAVSTMPATTAVGWKFYEYERDVSPKVNISIFY